MEQPRRATVWWNDAHGDVGNGSATHAEALTQHAPVYLATTGWVVKDDDVGVTLAMEWTPAQNNDHLLTEDYRGLSFKPRGMVERVEYLAGAVDAT